MDGGGLLHRGPKVVTVHVPKFGIVGSLPVILVRQVNSLGVLLRVILNVCYQVGLVSWPESSLDNVLIVDIPYDFMDGATVL